MLFRKTLAVFLTIIYVLGIVASCFVGAVSAQNSATSERSASFVNGALGFNSSQYTSASLGGRAGFDGDYMAEVGYTVNSDAGNLTIVCEYPNRTQGMWYVSLTIESSTDQLPVYAQLSANVTVRARDFLERYMQWSGNSSLLNAISMLDKVDVTRNMTVTENDLNLTVDSSPYFVSFYLEYQINGTEYRGVGITFASKYVFFRDDRSIPFGPRVPPASIFTSNSPYISGYSQPQEPITDVPLNQNFTFMTPRPAPIFELFLSPEANFSGPIRETRQFSGYFTFVLEEPLKPNTTYTETIIVGQGIPADFDSAPISIASWLFTTGNSLVTSEPTTSAVETASSSPSPSGVSPSPSVECAPSPFPTTTVAIAVILAALAVGGVAVIFEAKRRHPKTP